jgi:predicted nucleic acid-binding protein
MSDGIVLVDTSAWIEALRPSGEATIRTRVSALLAEKRVALMRIIAVELLTGAKDEFQYAELRADFAVLPLLDIDVVTWETCGGWHSSFDAKESPYQYPTC